MLRLVLKIPSSAWRRKFFNLHKFAHFTFGSTLCERKIRKFLFCHLLSCLEENFIIETRKCGSSSLTCPCYQIVFFLMASSNKKTFARILKRWEWRFKAHIIQTSPSNWDFIPIVFSCVRSQRRFSASVYPRFFIMFYFRCRSTFFNAQFIQDCRKITQHCYVVKLYFSSRPIVFD